MIANLRKSLARRASYHDVHGSSRFNNTRPGSFLGQIAADSNGVREIVRIRGAGIGISIGTCRDAKAGLPKAF